MAGFTAGPDFPTYPSGYNTFNLGMVVATMSPVQTANAHFGWVYTNSRYEAIPLTVVSLECDARKAPRTEKK